MLQARHQFLERGFHTPLIDALLAQIAAHLPADPGAAPLVDAGCGTGYYIGTLADQLAHTHPQLHCFFGIDVSKHAVRLAARRYSNVRFLVNDLKRQLTFANNSVAALLNIFAPRNVTEFARLLQPDGVLITVIPNATHWLELRAKLPMLSTPPEKRSRLLEQFNVHFALAAKQEVEYQRVMHADDIANLLRMSPNYWHLEAADLDHARSLDGLRLTLSFTILAFRKGNPKVG
jgi:23S rRNA (guanine745-N1)-methyltransferase